MATLYYLPGAVCAQKTLITVIAKNAPIELKEMTREDLASPGYRKLNPKGVVPTLVGEGDRPVVESSTIMRFIDEVYEGPALQPPTSCARAVVNNWIKLMDEELFPSVSYFTIATLLREEMGSLPPDVLLERQIRTSGAAIGALRADAAMHGVASHAVGAAIRTWSTTFEALSAQLRSTPWLGGEQASLAEIALAPAFLRLRDLGLSDWWAHDAPVVAEWWKRLCETPFMRAFEQRFPNPIASRLNEAAEELRDEVWRRAVTA